MALISSSLENIFEYLPTYLLLSTTQRSTLLGIPVYKRTSDESCRTITLLLTLEHKILLSIQQWNNKYLVTVSSCKVG